MNFIARVYIQTYIPSTQQQRLGLNYTASVGYDGGGVVETLASVVAEDIKTDERTHAHSRPSRVSFVLRTFYFKVPVGICVTCARIQQLVVTYIGTFTELDITMYVYAYL